MKPYSITREFWEGRSVFITGHTGFKGTWLGLWLESMGARVSGYSLHPPTQPSLFALTRSGTTIHTHIGDVRDAHALGEALRESAPEIVLHLAAQPIVRASYLDPVGTYGTNVMGTVHLLEAIRHTPSVRSVVVVSSDKCYENREWPWPYNETHQLGGFDPYSNSKACVELVADGFRRSFYAADRPGCHGASIATARAGNVIGGGDWAADRLVPDIIRALVRGEPVMLRNPAATRPWQHVLEPLSGYLALAEANFQDGRRFSGAWNFGPPDYANKSVRWMAETLCALWGEGSPWSTQAADGPHEAQFLHVDSSKARTLLGWAPRLDPITALEWTVAWSKAWVAGEDVRSVCLRQIDTYSSMPPLDPLVSIREARDAQSHAVPLLP